MDGNSIETWVKALQAGDESAYKRLFELHYAPLVGYLTTHTRDKAQAEDLAQYAFMKLWERRETLQADVSPRSLLYTIAHNRFVDQYRKGKRTSALMEELVQEHLRERITEDRDVLESRLAKLRQLIEQLPPRCREVLLLSRQRGLRHKEIAQQLGISPKTVEEQIRNAFKKIREGFKESNLILFLVSRLFPKFYGPRARS